MCDVKEGRRGSAEEKDYNWSEPPAGTVACFLYRRMLCGLSLPPSHSSYPLHVTRVRMEILLLKESSSEEVMTTAGAGRSDMSLSGVRFRDFHKITFFMWSCAEEDVVL